MTGAYAAWDTDEVQGFTDPTNEDVCAMFASPDTLYVATVGETGVRPIRIYRWDTGGVALTLLYSVDQISSSRERVKRIRMEQSSSDVWFVVGPLGSLTLDAAVGGLYHAADGLTFSRVGDGRVTGLANRLADLCIRESPTRRIWTLSYAAGFGPLVSYSDDDGLNWTAVTGISGSSSREGQLQNFPPVTGNAVVALVNRDIGVSGTTQHEAYESVDGESAFTLLGGFAATVISYWGRLFESDTQLGFSLSNDSTAWQETADHAATWAAGSGSWRGAGTSHVGSRQDSYHSRPWAFAIATSGGLRVYQQDIVDAWGNASVPNAVSARSACWVWSAAVEEDDRRTFLSLRRRGSHPLL